MHLRAVILAALLMSSSLACSSGGGPGSGSGGTGGHGGAATSSGSHHGAGASGGGGTGHAGGGGSGSGAGGSGGGGVVGTSPFTYLEPMLATTQQIAGFGSATPDMTRTTPARAKTYFIDPKDGDDAHDGLTPTSPRKTLPDLQNTSWIVTSDVAYLIRAGTTLPAPSTSAPTFQIESASNVTISVYEGDPSSPNFGQEVVDQPNPFDRAMARGWITDAELQAKYFTLDTERPVDNADTGTGYAGISIEGTGAHVVLRGINFVNFSAAALLVRGGYDVRMEDVFIGRVNRDPTLNASHFGGNLVRVDDSANGANLDIARLFVKSGPEDAFWFVAKHGDQMMHVADFAIADDLANQVYGCQHADVFQGQEAIGDFVVRRGMVEHVQRKPGAAMTDPNGPGGCVDQTMFQGKFFINSGSTTESLSIGNPTFEDVVVATSYEAFYLDSQKNFEIHRFGVVAVPRADCKPGADQVNFLGASTGVEDTTAYTFLDNRPSGRKYFAPSAPGDWTITNSTMP